MTIGRNTDTSGNKRERRRKKADGKGAWESNRSPDDTCLYGKRAGFDGIRPFFRGLMQPWILFADKMQKFPAGLGEETAFAPHHAHLVGHGIPEGERYDPGHI